jgi:MoaA/NifB/PqqE/SkfB family radical SAM enzyme
MRFPLRLTADLGVGLAGRGLRGKACRPLIFRLAPMEEADRPLLASEKPHNGQQSAAEIAACVRDCAAPVVWIGGTEPLMHPEIGRLTRSIVERGHHVFLQTDGNLLRRRIHEFQPVPRFFLAMELNGMEDSHDLRAGCKGAFHAAVEGIRRAKLSGFLICAYTAMDAHTRVHELKRLGEYLRTLKVDGWVILPSSGPASPAACKREAERQRLRDARRLILSRRWRLLSELVEAAATPRHAAEAAPAPDFARGPQSEPDVYDEGVQVP